MLSVEKIPLVVDDLFKVFSVTLINQKIIQKALLFAHTYRYSYFDCLMLASAINQDCTIIYSEDMHHLQILEGSLKIINPF